jgi:hypothetical protein
MEKAKAAGAFKLGDGAPTSIFRTPWCRCEFNAFGIFQTSLHNRLTFSIQALERKSCYLQTHRSHGPLSHSDAASDTLFVVLRKKNMRSGA